MPGPQQYRPRRGSSWVAVARMVTVKIVMVRETVAKKAGVRMAVVSVAVARKAVERIAMVRKTQR